MLPVEQLAQHGVDQNDSIGRVHGGWCDPLALAVGHLQSMDSTRLHMPARPEHVNLQWFGHLYDCAWTPLTPNGIARSWLMIGADISSSCRRDRGHFMPDC